MFKEGGGLATVASGHRLDTTPVSTHDTKHMPTSGSGLDMRRARGRLTKIQIHPIFAGAAVRRRRAKRLAMGR